MMMRFLNEVGCHQKKKKREDRASSIVVVVMIVMIVCSTQTHVRFAEKPLSHLC